MWQDIESVLLEETPTAPAHQLVASYGGHLTSAPTYGDQQQQRSAAPKLDAAMQQAAVTPQAAGFQVCNQFAMLIYANVLHLTLACVNVEKDTFFISNLLQNRIFSQITRQ
jgi:hypothetical protein